MQRIDQHKAGPLLPGNLGEVAEICKVANPPGPGGPHGVQLGRQPPGAAFREQGRGPEPAGRNNQRTLRRGACGVGPQGVPAEAEVAGDGERGTSREDAVDVDRLVPVLPLGGLVPAAVLGVDPDADLASVRDVDIDVGSPAPPSPQGPGAGCAARAPAGTRPGSVAAPGARWRGPRGPPARPAGFRRPRNAALRPSPSSWCRRHGLRRVRAGVRRPCQCPRAARDFRGSRRCRCLQDSRDLRGSRGASGPPCAHSRRCPHRPRPFRGCGNHLPVLRVLAAAPGADGSFGPFRRRHSDRASLEPYG